MSVLNIFLWTSPWNSRNPKWNHYLSLFFICINTVTITLVPKIRNIGRHPFSSLNLHPTDGQVLLILLCISSLNYFSFPKKLLTPKYLHDTVIWYFKRRKRGGGGRGEEGRRKRKMPISWFPSLSAFLFWLQPLETWTFFPRHIRKFTPQSSAQALTCLKSPCPWSNPFPYSTSLCWMPITCQVLLKELRMRLRTTLTPSLTRWSFQPWVENSREDVNKHADRSFQTVRCQEGGKQCVGLGSFRSWYWEECHRLGPSGQTHWKRQQWIRDLNFKKVSIPRELGENGIPSRNGKCKWPGMIYYFSIVVIKIITNLVIYNNTMSYLTVLLVTSLGLTGLKSRWQQPYAPL